MLRTLLLIVAMTAPVLSVAQLTATPSGTPETTLAGIELGRTTFAEIQKMYGKPNVSNSAGGSTLFQWQRLTVTLTVATVFNPKNPHDPNGTPISIAIQGEGDRENTPVNRSGRGLKLGAKASEVKKLYGVEAPSGTTNLTWTNGTALAVRVGEKGKVDRMELTSTGAAAAQ
jgi:hypothetical protein